MRSLAEPSGYPSPWVPPSRPALAYATASGVQVLGRGSSGGVTVGSPPSYGPAWSLDGRYLAWAEQGARRDVANAPDDDPVVVLDTTTGARVRVPEAGAALNGQVFAVPGGFVLPVSGANNLGHRAEDLLVVDLAGGLDGLAVRRRHTRLGATCSADIDTWPDSGPDGGCDTEWTQALGDRLVAVLTEASGTYYRYCPHVYSVGLDGSVRRLFGPGKDDTHNDGEPRLAYSTDGSRSAVFDSVRNGIDVYSQVVVGGATGAPSVRPSGLPAIPADTTEYGGLSWTRNGDLLVALRHGKTRSTPAGTRLPADGVYRCAHGNGCVPLGVVASEVVEAADGSLALVRDGPDRTTGDRRSIVVVRRPGAPEVVVSGAGPVWGPA